MIDCWYQRGLGCDLRLSSKLVEADADAYALFISLALIPLPPGGGPEVK